MAFNINTPQPNFQGMEQLIQQSDPFKVLGNTMTELDSMLNQRTAKEYMAGLDQTKMNDPQALYNAFVAAPNQEAKKLITQNLQGLAAIQDMRNNEMKALSSLQNKSNTFRMLSPEEKTQMGLPIDKPFQIDQTGKVAGIGGSGQNININTGDTQYGKLEPGYQRVKDPITGIVKDVPITGSKAERELIQEQKKVQQGIKDTQNLKKEMGNFTDKLNQALTSPGLEKATGWQSMFPTIPGTEAADFENTLETIKSNLFMDGIQKMKGMGALSDAEGKKVDKVLASLQLSQSDASMKQQLKTLLDVFKGKEDILNETLKDLEIQQGNNKSSLDYSKAFR